MASSAESVASSSGTQRPGDLPKDLRWVSFNDGKSLEIYHPRDGLICFKINNAPHLGVLQKKPLCDLMHSMYRPRPWSEACTVTVLNMVDTEVEMGPILMEIRLKGLEAFCDDIWSRKDFLDGLLMNVLPTQEEDTRKMLNRTDVPSRWWAVISQPGLPLVPCLSTL
ncbi:hypothetical protein K491DRAFT_135096 [Lophiostoma macrostomum CBS 122681]|uniref:Uncharacterized protein n=1 Tax=Lophiostoma macrostomum CBS 122681 TaxID=1314788 RepID=A0A6A6TLD8_9PLEO|nr:hypothetical protein K491DRAFT_135096 [Lophiostoma macrostomum CBS 122681]